MTLLLVGKTTDLALISNEQLYDLTLVGYEEQPYDLDLADHKR